MENFLDKINRGVSIASTLRIVLVVSFLISLIDTRPYPNRSLHHIVNSEHSDEWDSSTENEQASHDLIIKLILDIINVLPQNKLNELDSLLSKTLHHSTSSSSSSSSWTTSSTINSLDIPQADMPGAVLEDAVDLEDQAISKDLPGSSDLEEYRGEVMALDDMNSTQSGSSNASFSDLAERTAKLPKIRESDNDTLDVQRDKDIHLNSIKNKILGFFQTTGRKPGNWSDANPQHKEILKEMIRSMTNITPVPPPEDYTEKTQSFYPACNVPPNTDEDLWYGGKIMNLNFNLRYPATVNGTLVFVKTAKLWLYKLSPVNTTVTLSENCAPAASGDSKSVKICSVRIGDTMAADEKRLMVSIYRYTKSLNKTQRKRKLLDSKMIPATDESWTEWDIKGAVRAWRESKNFGLAVKVEDEDGTVLPADRYFASMNCSRDMRGMKPIPGFLVDATRDLMMNNNGSSSSEATNRRAYQDSPYSMYPMIDVCMSEISEDQHLKMSLEESLKRFNTTNFASILQSGKVSGVSMSMNRGAEGPTGGGGTYLRLNPVALFASDPEEQQPQLQQQRRFRHHNKRKYAEAAFTE